VLLVFEGISSVYIIGQQTIPGSERTVEDALIFATQAYRDIDVELSDTFLL